MPQQPYGDIFQVGTPYLDRVSQQLYQEQKQRELYLQQQNKMLDDEFSRNLSGIRDADIGDLTKAYGEFKLANINTLKKKGGVSPQDQLEVLRKKANVYDIINKSKQDREWETAQGKQIMTDKKGLYADDAHAQLIKRIGTPVSQLDKSKDADLLYKYYLPDLTKTVKIANGEEKEIPIKIGKNKLDPFKDDTEIYKAGNAPDKFANVLLENMVTGGSKDSRNFIGVMNNKYDEATLEDLKNKYTAKVNDPNFIKVYGEPKPLPAMDTDLGKAVAIRTMEEFANKEIKPIKIKSEVNTANKDAVDFEQAKVLARMRNQYAINRLRLAADLKDDADNEDELLSVNAVLRNIKDKVDEGDKTSKTSGISGMYGGNKNSNIIPIADAGAIKLFSSVKKIGTTTIPPDNITFDKNKKQFNLNYSYDNSSIPISERDYVTEKVKEIYGGKKLADVNKIVDNILTEKGGLYNTLKMYDEQPPTTNKKTAAPTKSTSGVKWK